MNNQIPAKQALYIKLGIIAVILGCFAWLGIPGIEFALYFAAPIMFIVFAILLWMVISIGKQLTHKSPTIVEPLQEKVHIPLFNRIMVALGVTLALWLLMKVISSSMVGP